MPSNKDRSMSQDTQAGDDSQAERAGQKDQDSPTPVHIWHPDLRHVRREVLWKWALTTVVLMAVILGFLSLYYGALFNAEENLSAMVVAVVDFDGQTAPFNTSNVTPIIGPEIIRLARTNIASGMGLGYLPLSASDFDHDPINVRQAVYDQRFWAAFIINANATTSLQNAISTGDTSFTPLGIAQLVYVQARDQTAWDSYMYPYIAQFMTEAVPQAGSVWTASALQQARTNTTIMDNIAAIPQVLSPGIGFSVFNLRPFYPFQVTPTVTVGLIYLIILSFFSFTFYLPVYMKLIKPEGHPPAHFWQMVGVRYIGIQGAYMFLSLAYTLVSLAFQINFSSSSSVQSETMVTPVAEGNPVKFGAATFPALWCLNWLGMAALGLACENVSMIIGMPWTGLWLIFWVISNVSTAFYPIEIEPRFYYWGYAWPLHNVVEATRCLLFDLHSRLGLNYGVLVAWAAVHTIVFPFACKVMAAKNKRNIKGYWA